MDAGRPGGWVGRQVDTPRRQWRSVLGPTLLIGLFLTVGGCGPTYHQWRRDGQEAMARGAYGPAQYFFQKADDLRPRVPENLHDLAACSVMLAREKFEEGNHAAAMRELDAAIAYYSAAIESYPGHQPSIEGKHIALKLKGQFEEATKHAEWAAEFVGPSAHQYILLAKDLEERGERDAALLRYRQAVAVEPENPKAHTAIAKFLLKNDNDSAAVQHLQMAYRIDPRNEWVVTELTNRGALPPLSQTSDEMP